MKIPDPIIDPATSIVESSKPSSLTNLTSASGGSGPKSLSVWAACIAGELTIAQEYRATPKHWARIGIVVLMLAAIIVTNVTINVFFPSYSGYFPFIGVRGLAGPPPFGGNSQTGLGSAR
jgi:hypothetical protein